MEKESTGLEDFEKRFSAIILETSIGQNLDRNLIEVNNAIRESNDAIDSSTNKPSDNSGMHQFKIRMLFLGNSIMDKIKELDEL